MSHLHTTRQTCVKNHQLCLQLIFSCLVHHHKLKVFTLTTVRNNQFLEFTGQTLKLTQQISASAKQLSAKQPYAKQSSPKGRHRIIPFRTLFKFWSKQTSPLRDKSKSSQLDSAKGKALNQRHVTHDPLPTLSANGLSWLHLLEMRQLN